MRLRNTCRELARANFLEDGRPTEGLFGLGATVRIDGQAREKGAPLGLERRQVVPVDTLEVARRSVKSAQLFRTVVFKKIATKGSDDGVSTRTRFEGKAAAERATQIRRKIEREEGGGFFVRGGAAIGIVEVGRFGEPLDEAAGQRRPRNRAVKMPRQRNAEQSIAEGRSEHVRQLVA